MPACFLSSRIFAMSKESPIKNAARYPAIDERLDNE